MGSFVEHPPSGGPNFRSLSLPVLLVAACLGGVKESQALLDDSQVFLPPPRVASFNIRHFGNAKMSRPTVVENILKILDRYDLVFIMETRDQRMTSLVQLRQELGEQEWDYVTSKPIGRSSYKELYVFFYRPKVVTLLGSQKFKDTQDVFERDPYIAEFQYFSHFSGSEVKVTFIGAHLDPDDVVAEMRALPEVISTARRLFPESGAYITMGDLNADCYYMDCLEREQTALFSSPELYTSLIPDKADTTVSHNTHCAYDRVVVTVHDHPKLKVANVTVYNFEVDLGLSFDDAWAVSDHYPVEFILA